MEDCFYATVETKIGQWFYHAAAYTLEIYIAEKPWRVKRRRETTKNYIYDSRNSDLLLGTGV